jgi:hypothetical protein
VCKTASYVIVQKYKVLAEAMRGIKKDDATLQDVEHARRRSAKDYSDSKTLIDELVKKHILLMQHAFSYVLPRFHES